MFKYTIIRAIYGGAKCTYCVEVKSLRNVNSETKSWQGYILLLILFLLVIGDVLHTAWSGDVVTLVDYIIFP